MATFDFIGGEDFRASLEADYRELSLALKGGAWKASHVLAGSIIEAILIDYLIVVNYQKNGATNPLNMSLAEAVSACRRENIISQKAADLSSVIRQYRNLIHPGRAVRLGEVPDENGAKVAEALVNIIIDEISARKQKTYGYTAEQIATKIERDSSAMVIMEDLMRGANQLELERLLLKIIPDRYFELMVNEAFLGNTLASLAEAFRLAFSLVSDEVRSKAMRNFVVILKEESERKVLAYEEAFLKGIDLLYLSSEDALLVKKHLLARLKNGTASLLRTTEGLGQFLTSDEISDFIDPLIKDMNRSYSDFEIDREAIYESLRNEIYLMTGEAKRALLNRLDTWIEFCRDHKFFANAEKIEDIKSYFADDQSPEEIPF